MALVSCNILATVIAIRVLPKPTTSPSSTPPLVQVMGGKLHRLDLETQQHALQSLRDGELALTLSGILRQVIGHLQVNMVREGPGSSRAQLVSISWTSSSDRSKAKSSSHRSSNHRCSLRVASQFTTSTLSSPCC